MLPMACRCDTVGELYGVEAAAYIAEHLRREPAVPEELEERLTCPDTGREWLLDYRDRTERELGQARLRARAAVTESGPE